MHIVDKDGEWFQNFGSYPLADGESGTVFQPGVPTKASVTKWLAQQLLFVAPLTLLHL